MFFKSVVLLIVAISAAAESEYFKLYKELYCDKKI